MMSQAQCTSAAFEALKSAAFEERVNKHREAADWWRERAAMWFRRANAQRPSQLAMRRFQ